MRRALLVLLALPAHGLAQTTVPSSGAVTPDTTDSTTINIAQCTGTQNAVRGSADALSLTLNWTAVAKDSVTVPVSGDLFRVYAANQQPAAGQSTGTSCTQPASTSSTFTVNQVGGDIDLNLTNNGGLTYQGQSEAYKDLVAGAGFTCNSTTSTATLYLCVQWVDSSGGIKGWANGTLSLDLRVPTNAPILAANGVTAGDGTLHVNASGNDPLTVTCKALATGDKTAWSSEGSCGGLTISGLTNNVTYSVVVYGLTSAENPSDASNAEPGTPIPTDDFWQHYHAVGGREQGGCGGPAGAAAILAALSLLALRRRKP
ncbi:MAG TPA: hypothetical protein VFG59_21530 [Anaeromyxobacter sp.]|nr:hypothetical protein [Anaeromyxobacter sp.]